MKIRDLLKNFKGNCKISIHDYYDGQTHNYENSKDAILWFGYYNVKSWTIDEDKTIGILVSSY